MAFLFGDLTPAPFTTNFLEELRDVIDFAARIAATDQTIVNADATREALRSRAGEDAARLEALVRSVLDAADAADKGGEGSLAPALAAQIAKLVAERHEAASAALTSRLAAAISAKDAATLSAREDYFVLLEAFLLEHVPAGAAATVRVELVAPRKDDRRYTATLTGRSDLGLEWAIEMAVPEETWQAPLRVESIADGLSIVAPQVTGLIKKEVKPKRQKLDRQLVTTVVCDDANLHVELRAEIGGEEGYDITAALDESGLVAVKVGAAEDVTLGPFDVAPEDLGALFAFASKLRAMTGALSKRRLVAATFDGLPFDGRNDDAQPRLVELVPRLVAQLAPAVDQIAARSRSEDELVLRMQVDDGHRYEIFMPKARLRENLATLDAAHRLLFSPFAAALDAKPPEDAPRGAIPDAPESVRSEVPPLIRRRSGTMDAVVVPASPPVPQSAMLAHIRAIEKDGNADEAYRQYAVLFANPTFATSSPEEQRQALKVMIFGKPPPSATEELRAAHRAAVPALQALIVAHHEPADYEMLGMAYVGGDEPEKGSEIFKRALELERARDSASDLCGSLMRRVSQL